jgi:UPF0271 protein
MKQIDLNSDMGEIPELIHNGTQEALMRSLSSVNIACGGHAGDEATMKTTIEQALRWKLALGAHPGYPDRENFGRIDLDMSPAAIADTVFEQVRAFADIVAKCGASVAHVKAHGELYNAAGRRQEVARAIASGVARWSKEVVLMGLAGSPMLDIFRDAGFTVVAEAFADRRYEPDGSLRSRRYPDALIPDPHAAAEQVLRMVEHGTVTAVDGSEVRIDAQTICIHSDTPGAPKIAAAVAATLRAAGITLAPQGQRARTL